MEFHVEHALPKLVPGMAEQSHTLAMKVIFTCCSQSSLLQNWFQRTFPICQRAFDQNLGGGRTQSDQVPWKIEGRLPFLGACSPVGTSEDFAGSPGNPSVTSQVCGICAIITFKE